MQNPRTLTARNAFLIAGLLLLVCAGVISILTIRAVNAERSDSQAAMATMAAQRADAAAEALNAQLQRIGDLLASLAAKGGGKAGGGGALGLAAKAFNQIDGLEQLAAYGMEGRTRWVMRPADKGPILFPKGVHFLPTDTAGTEPRLRLGAPFQLVQESRRWTPVSLTVNGASKAGTALIVAFVRSDAFQTSLAAAGNDAAMFTDQGILAAAEPAANAPVGASFLDAPGFRLIGDGEARAGTYVGGAGPDAASVVGFRKLECCGVIVTAVAMAAPAASALATGHWWALAVVGLIIALALVVTTLRAFEAAPDPWRDFGRNRAQSRA